MRLSNRLEIVPPVVRVVEELLHRLGLKFPLQTCLSFDNLFRQKLLSGERWTQIDMHGQHSETTLVRQADRQDLSIDFNLITVESWAPIDVFGSKDDWLLVHSVLQDSYVDGLVKFEEHRWVEFDLFIIANELKHESLIEDRV